MVAHLLIAGPGHDLEQLSGIVEVRALSQNLFELFVCTTRRKPVFRRQVAGDERPEGHPAREIVRGVDLLGLALERVTPVREMWIGMAVVAPADSVDEIAAKADEFRILAFEIERDRRDFEAAYDAFSFGLVVPVIMIAIIVVAALAPTFAPPTPQRPQIWLRKEIWIVSWGILLG